MANKNHLNILRQGVDTWNKWREDHPEIQPDLSSVDIGQVQPNLSNANLNSANLRQAILKTANLKNTKLNHADLGNADLRGNLLIFTDFTQANFRDAKLRDATFRGGSLKGVDLRDIELSATSFRGTDLKDTNFSGSQMWGTTFVSIDLSVAIGLEQVIHEGPSVIDIRTLYSSKGKIPEAFLRGIGIPESFITYIPSLIKQPIQFYSCFISYSSRDQDFAARLHADLQSKGVRCWFAPKDLKIGDRIRDEIDESIRVHDKLLLIVSENSILSDWVEHEVESALEEERKEMQVRKKRTILFPIRLDDAINRSERAWAALLRRTRHIGDFRDWKDHDAYQKAFNRLIDDLKAEDSLNNRA